MASAENRCCICGKPFHEEDKVMLTAQAFVVREGYWRGHKGEEIPSNAKVKIRFRSGWPRTVCHLSCHIDMEQEMMNAKYAEGVE